MRTFCLVITSLKVWLIEVIQQGLIRFIYKRVHARPPYLEVGVAPVERECVSGSLCSFLVF